MLLLPGDTGHTQSGHPHAAAAGTALEPLQSAGQVNSGAAAEAEGETVALLHGPPSAARGPGGQPSAGGQAGAEPWAGGAALEQEGGAGRADGAAVLALVHCHILPLFFLLALLCSIDRGARLACAWGRVKINRTLHHAWPMPGLRLDRAQRVAQRVPDACERRVPGHLCCLRLPCRERCLACHAVPCTPKQSTWLCAAMLCMPGAAPGSFVPSSSSQSSALHQSMACTA